MPNHVTCVKGKTDKLLICTQKTCKRTHVSLLPLTVALRHKRSLHSMRKSTVNERTKQPISRQRKWQLRQKQKGLCEKCSKPAAPESVYCIEHMVAHRVTARRNYKLWRGRTRPYWRTKSHRLAAAVDGEMSQLWSGDVQKLLMSRWPEHRDLARRALRERPELAPKEIDWTKLHRTLLNQLHRHSGGKPTVAQRVTPSAR